MHTAGVHGHVSGLAGVVYYEGWADGSANKVSPNTNWVALCTSSNPKRMVLNNEVVMNNLGFATTTAVRELDINGPGGHGASYGGGQYGDFEAVEVITWDRALTPTEMQSVMTDIWSVRMGN